LPVGEHAQTGRHINLHPNRNHHGKEKGREKESRKEARLVKKKNPARSGFFLFLL